MHPKIAMWLDLQAKEGKTALTYMAELIAVNYGQFEVTRFGQVIPNNSFWGREGLTPTEALDLINMSSFLKGMMFFIGQDQMLEIKEIIQAEIDRLEKGTVIYVPTSQETKAFGSGGIDPRKIRRNLGARGTT